jgi:gamma-glutamylcyclotransferase (GGCT)/AIG2-like uncharacterized protein YtfP
MAMRIIIFIVAILLFNVGISFSQSKKKKKRDQQETTQSSSPTSLDPSFNQNAYVPKKEKRKSVSGPTYESEQEYYERLDALEKTRRKNEKMLEKPQYTDPMYFGHKRPPKKRPPGKMKFCKVCGIRH